MKPPEHPTGDASRRTFRCPACGRAVKAGHGLHSQAMRFFPFCSERCKLIDLGAWLDADYRIPCGPDETSEGPPLNDHSSNDESP